MVVGNAVGVRQMRLLKAFRDLTQTRVQYFGLHSACQGLETLDAFLPDGHALFGLLKTALDAGLVIVEQLLNAPLECLRFCHTPGSPPG